MADQTSVSPNAANDNGVVGSITGFTADVFTLVELQAKLASVDLKEATARAVAPLAVVAVCLVVVLGGVSVFLAGVAALIARAFGISEGWALVLTSGAALAASLGLILVSIRQVTHCLQPVRRSQEELVRNLTWLRTVLVHSGRPVPPRAGR